MDEVVFGRYRLIEVIGEGGMGKVYKAHDTVIGRDVAVKVLSTELGAEPGFRERFRREAHTAARLTEPHIIPIHDTGEVDGRLYLVMPIINGTDVGTLLEREGPMSPQRAVVVVEQLAAALDAAHAAGLVHRDVKPSNALMTNRDFTYLIDFGITQDVAATRVTKTGVVIGTLAYMAPERFNGGVADARADVYSLTCLLHECLTGAQPYPGGSAEQQIAAHLTLNPPKPTDLSPAVPAAFNDVIARGMAKKPTDRFVSAGELARAANAAAELSQAPTVLASNPRPRPGTRPFSAKWPNPDGTGDIPYPDHLHAPQPTARKFGHGRLLLVAGAAATFVAAALMAAWLILQNNQASPSTSNATAMSTAPSTRDKATESPTIRTTLETTSKPRFTLPGTDAQGFVGYPAGRCDPSSTPAFMGRTTQSLIVVCEVGPADYYYRGVRLSDGASIELANAVRSSGGFDVTNPVDGTRYQVRPSRISITSPSGQVFSEPMIEYAAR
ncbi:serine/threonine-protein kinase [Mycobacterium intracellulare]|uniref:non-specific serine/threonine protein kinase n=1 Tax=Mycobacterium intracellulare subsp. chimaera TaxID=222805 RepID=A0A7U5MMI3_MYCIT|nr:serine/threonine-protein kinase [Mycobacterium intracellulare]ASL16265.1 serine/threonine protein kinase [Mycobacterium intracellulare subsp. chimaera]ASQ87348.1 serine/threonine protein kinase [Mycobacterium intracellulare subsp. chimaera]MCF1816004.1 serine/threonine protein kinase [Mycobacterium intracellulare subsp. intracellulare]MDM3928997.1 serine/threonine-protein kinase [Mycobacterium intracellulare subsp. chimaera]MDS0337906.1 serine/threonine protein kinase [Mycobacterium intrace